MAKKDLIKSRLNVGTEEEVLLGAKDWLKENGKSLAGGVILGIAGLGGWQGWHGYQANYFNQAAVLYAEYLNDAQENAYHIETLITEYIDTPYPSLALLQRAFSFVENDELDKAVEDLQWVSENSVETGIATIAKMRQIRILLAQKKYQAVLNELNTFYYTASADKLAEEIRGDAYAGLGNKKEASAAYKKVLSDLPPSISKEMLLVKLSRVSN